MPVPAIVPLVSLVFGGFNVGNSSYHLMKGPQQALFVEGHLREIYSALSTMQTQMLDMEINQGLRSHVDATLGFFDSYKDTIVPTLNALRGLTP